MFNFETKFTSTLSLKVPPAPALADSSVMVQVIIVPLSLLDPCTPFDLTSTLIKSPVYGVYAAPDSSTF